MDIDRAKMEYIVANLREAADTLKAVATALEQVFLSEPSERSKS